MGEAIACFFHDTAEIEISLPNAFGMATTPSMVGDFTDRDNHYEFPEAVGVIYHEALHARFSGWNFDTLMELFEKNDKVRSAFWLLEESRIESKGVLLMPENALFLRCSALGLSVNGADDYVKNVNTTEAIANLAGLTLARVSGDVLDEFDVAGIQGQIIEVLGEDTLSKLRSIWVEFQELHATDFVNHKRGVELAKEWVEAIDERSIERGETPTAPKIIVCALPSEGEGEGEGSGSGVALGEGEGKGSGSIPQEVQDLLDKLAEQVSDTAVDTQDELADQQTKEQEAKLVKSKQKETARQEKNKESATKVFSTSSGGTGSGSSSRIQEVRQPRSDERIGAVQLAKALEKAKYVERSITTLSSEVPKGKLRPRALVQKRALESKGVRSDLPTWRYKTRKHNDDPTLTIGVMVDVSGSMGTAMNPMASIAWILSEAGHRVQAKTAMVYYGSGVFPTLKVGQRLAEVNVYSAPDGTEEFGQAYSALDGTLNLVAGEGVRMLVIVSDGNYRPDQDKEVEKALKECQRNGVAVLWISPKECYSHGAESLTAGTHATLVKITDTASIATEIGKSASTALARVASLAQ
jgi:uncharacterized protein with von Willebrand factor type A (vWA) domain